MSTSRMKEIKKSRSFAILLTLIACSDPRLDSSNEISAANSVQQVRSRLAENERSDFDMSLLAISASLMDGVDISSGEAGKKRHEKNFLEAVHGKTATEVIQLAREIKAKRQFKTEAEKATECADLVRKKIAARISKGKLARFIVLDAELQKQSADDVFETAIKLTVKNVSGHTVTQAFFRVTVISRDDNRPFIEDEIYKLIPEGLAHGEKASWIIYPNMLSPLAKRTLPDHVALKAVATRLDGPEKTKLISTEDFTASDDERLQQLIKSGCSQGNDDIKAREALEKGKRLFDVGDDSRALHAINEAIQSDPTLDEAHFYRGRLIIDDNDAIGEFSEALGLNPANTKAFAMRAAKLFHMRDISYQVAIAQLNAALKINSSDSTLLIDRASVYAGNGDLESALADFNTAIARDRRPSFLARRGLVMAKKGDFASAIKDIDEALSELPSHPRHLYIRGVIREMRGDYEQAIQEHDEAIRHNPHFADAFFARGYVKLLLRQYDAAILDFNEAIRLGLRVPEVFHERGNAWYLKGNLFQAEADYTNAVTLRPDFAIGFKARAIVKSKQGLQAQASEDCKKAISLDPLLANQAPACSS